MKVQTIIFQIIALIEGKITAELCLVRNTDMKIDITYILLAIKFWYYNYSKIAIFILRTYIKSFLIHQSVYCKLANDMD